MNFNRQEIFNTAYLGIKAQGFQRSYDDLNDTCVFIHENGSRCAVGHCFTDQDLSLLRAVNPVIDNLGMSQILPILGAPKEDGRLDTFLLQLQDTHDGAETSDQMKSRLEAFAVTNGLEVPNDQTR